MVADPSNEQRKLAIQMANLIAEIRAPAAAKAFISLLNAKTIKSSDKKHLIERLEKLRTSNTVPSPEKVLDSMGFQQHAREAAKMAGQGVSRTDEEMDERIKLEEESNEERLIKEVEMLLEKTAKYQTGLTTLLDEKDKLLIDFPQNIIPDEGIQKYDEFLREVNKNIKEGEPQEEGEVLLYKRLDELHPLTYHSGELVTKLNTFKTNFDALKTKYDSYIVDSNTFLREYMRKRNELIYGVLSLEELQSPTFDIGNSDALKALKTKRDEFHRELENVEKLNQNHQQAYDLGSQRLMITWQKHYLMKLDVIDQEIGQQYNEIRQAVSHGTFVRDDFEAEFTHQTDTFKEIQRESQDYQQGGDLLSNKIDTVSRKINFIQEQLSQITTPGEELRKAEKDLEDEVSKLNTGVNDLQRKVGRINSKKTRLDEALDILDQLFSTQDLIKSRIPRLRATPHLRSSTIIPIEDNKLDNIKTTLDDLQRTLTTKETEINNLIQAAATAAQQAANNPNTSNSSLDSVIRRLEQKIEDLETAAQNNVRYAQAAPPGTPAQGHAQVRVDQESQDIAELQRKVAEVHRNEQGRNDTQHNHRSLNRTNRPIMREHEDFKEMKKTLKKIGNNLDGFTHDSKNVTNEINLFVRRNQANPNPIDTTSIKKETQTIIAKVLRERKHFTELQTLRKKLKKKENNQTSHHNTFERRMKRVLRHIIKGEETYDEKTLTRLLKEAHEGETDFKKSYDDADSSISAILAIEKAMCQICTNIVKHLTTQKENNKEANKSTITKYTNELNGEFKKLIPAYQTFAGNARTLVKNIEILTSFELGIIREEENVIAEVTNTVTVPAQTTITPTEQTIPSSTPDSRGGNRPPTFGPSGED